MEEQKKANVRKGGKRKMSGWLIALIVVVVIFAAGAICCNTIGKKTPSNAAPTSAVSGSAQQEND